MLMGRHSPWAQGNTPTTKNPGRILKPIARELNIDTSLQLVGKVVVLVKGGF